MKIVVLSLLLMGGDPVGEDTGPVEPVVLPELTDEDLLGMQPEGAMLETRLDADFNGDGLMDTAYVTRVPDEWRKLAVQMGYVAETDMGHDPVGEAAMDVHPLGMAALVFKKGVLVVEDLAGGTSAISSTYRYRYDKAEHRMRLIGDDVMYYSRTDQHDRTEISTNRLTGQRTRQRFRLTGEEYAPEPMLQETVPKVPLYMEDAPLPDVTLGLGEAG